MNCLRLAAVSISVLGMALPLAAAWGQGQPTARLTSREEAGPPLSTRALPAAPTVHRLSIGPLSAPSDDMVLAPVEPGDSGAASTLARANRGDPEANYRLGLALLAGEGITRDLVEAFARIRLAAEAGHPRAISLFYSLGAKLTASEHAKAFDRSKEIRAGSIATVQKLSTGTAAK